MKKLLSILVVLMMLVSAFAVAEAADLSGVWYLTTVFEDGQELDPAMFGMEMSMSLNADGSAIIATTGEDEVSGTWEATAAGVAVTAEGDTLELAYVDGTLKSEDMGMLFAREKSETEAFNPGNLRSDAALADFNGKWNATMVSVMGMTLPMELLGSASCEILDGSVTFNIEMQDILSESQTIPTQLADGVLSVPGDTTNSISLKLYDTGILEMGISIVTIYLELEPAA